MASPSQGVAVEQEGQMWMHDGAPMDDDGPMDPSGRLMGHGWRRKWWPSACCCVSSGTSGGGRESADVPHELMRKSVVQGAAVTKEHDQWSLLRARVCNGSAGSSCEASHQQQPAAAASWAQWARTTCMRVGGMRAYASASVGSTDASPSPSSSSGAPCKMLRPFVLTF